MLLATKFLRPSSGPHCVPRERLYKLLDRATPKRLNLIVAPAGFGKTTLAAQWCARHPTPSAWLSLDNHDDDPLRFWQYLVGTLAHAGLPGLNLRRKLPASDSEDDVTAGIHSLINILAEDGRPWSLVLDDVQVIRNRSILRQLAYFIDYLPPGVMVTLVSRSEPALPLSRWRVRHWVQDIHPALLAFTSSECRQFFHDTMALPLADEEMSQVYQRTEGWVAAMQLAALARNRDTTAESIQSRLYQDVPHHTGERQISDYILTEVLDHQATEHVRFMLDTACCPRLCASVCDSIRGADDSQEQLQALYRLNLFLVPLDEQGQWYRYHDLFRDALLQRIRQTDPKRAAQLWQKTVHWLLEHDQVQEAVSQILQQQDWQWLAQVLEEHGNNLIHGGHHLPVLNWLRSLPDAVINQRPHLQMLRIWGLFFANRLASIEELLATLEEVLAQPGTENGDRHGLHSEMTLVRAYLARSRNDNQRARDLTRQVLEDLDHTRIPLKSVTYYGLGLDGYGRGDLVSAEEALRASVRYGRAEQQPSTVLSSGGLLAWIQYHRGNAEEALETASSVQQWVDQQHREPGHPRLISCWLNSALTEICRERNEPDQAAAHLAPLLEHVNQGTEPGQHVVIQYVRAHLAFSLGHYQEAVEVLEDATDVCRHSRSQMVFEPPACAALLARCYLAAGNPDKALLCITRLEPGSLTNPMNREQHQICQARVLVGLSRLREAWEILRPLRDTTGHNDHSRHQLEVMMLQAEILHLENRETAARALLDQVLPHASKAGFLRLFAEESPRLQQLVLSMPALTAPGNWNRKLRTLLQYTREPTIRPASGPELQEPLSQREQEVLKLINEGYANKDIAEKLSVAPATVKAHIRNLYGKLGVRRRTEALARARALDLLA